jgi:hydroxymethylcytosylglucuronate/cytosylglucuronate synthase
VSSILLAAVCDFGWGSLGKFRLILDHLPATEVALYGDAQINAIAADLLRERHRFVPLSPERTGVALVINDPAAANRIAEQGLPVIYVDSLPYLWSTPDEIPARHNVAIYCAQKFPVGRLPVSKVLTERGDVQWVDPIVPTSGYRNGGQGVIVNVGGLHSHLVGDTVAAYLQLVLTPLLRELRRWSMPVLGVCGNLPADYQREVRERFPECKAVGPTSPYEFERLLRDADLLVTSPGSTTILQALSLNLPTLLLPPQNLSQILNTRLFSRPSAPSMAWPISVIQPDRIEELRPEGEDEVLAYIYGSICAASASEAAARDVASTIRIALRDRPKDGVLDAALRALGSNGAAQVAQRIRQAMLAPLPRPRAR